jgi:hypothetical protein
MGNRRGDNGGNELPQEGGGLPDLPPEWGTIIVPDHPGALDHEGAAVRRAFRHEAFRRRWRRRLHLRSLPVHRIDEDSPGLAVPLLIMTVAVVATLTSLFAVAWPGARPKAVPRPASSEQTATVAGVAMIDGDGTRVRLQDLSPAVILLVDRCPCDTLVQQTFDAVSAARPQVAVTASTTASTPGAQSRPGPGQKGGQSAAQGTVPPHAWVLVVNDLTVPGVPALSSPTVSVRGLSDRDRALRAVVPALANEPTHTAAVLVDRNGTVLRVVPRVGSIADFKADLTKLW